MNLILYEKRNEYQVESRDSKLFIIKEMKTKTTVRYYHSPTPIKIAKNEKKKTTIQVQFGCGANVLFSLVMMQNGTAKSENTLTIPYKTQPIM